MEKINKEYQKLIDTLESVKGNQSLESNRNALDYVIYSLGNLGARPVLPDDVDQFIDITQNMAKTFAAKNHDYGNSFEQSLNEFGIVASVVRMGDKMNRIKSLVKKEAQVKDESIKDTLIDLANYAIMTVMWMDKNNNQDNAAIH